MGLDPHSMNVVFALERFRMKYPEWRLKHARKLVNEIILSKIKESMAEAGYHEKVIRETRVRDVTVDAQGTITYQIVSDYTTDDGFNVGDAMEDGTRRHFVAPRFRKALRWGNVKWIFSKGHFVRGIRRHKIIERTIRRRTAMLQRALDKDTDLLFYEMVGNAGNTGR